MIKQMTHIIEETPLMKRVVLVCDVTFTPYPAEKRTREYPGSDPHADIESVSVASYETDEDDSIPVVRTEDNPLFVGLDAVMTWLVFRKGSPLYREWESELLEMLEADEIEAKERDL